MPTAGAATFSEYPLDASRNQGTVSAATAGAARQNHRRIGANVRDIVAAPSTIVGTIPIGCVWNRSTASAAKSAVCGHDRDRIGILAWPNPGACRQLVAGASDAASLACAPEVRQIVRRGLSAHNAGNPGASTRITRVMLLTEPPSIDANEITDKGYVNQRAVLEHRAALVERLFAEPPGPDVIVCD